ncbi:MAG: hypothetical protein WAO19_08535 [Candidatus Kryptoniota bacterium]
MQIDSSTVTLIQAIGLLFVLVGMLGSAFVASYVAGEKGYPSGTWFFIGLFLPLVGLIGAAGLPNKIIE